MKTLTLAVVVTLVRMIFASAHAAMITLTATDAGFVTEMGGSAKGDGTLAASATYNYSVGREEHYMDGSLGMPPGSTPPSPMDRKNYFVFDLSGVTDPIISATFMVYAGTLESPVDGFEMFEIKETTAPVSALADIGALATGNMIGFTEFDEPTDPLVGMAAALYTKLADGPLLLGGAAISSADDGMTLAIPITAGGLSYLNLFLGSSLVLGGTVPTAIPPGFPQQPFGFTGPDIPGDDPLTPTLVITTLSTAVPEPSVGALALVGVWVLMFRKPAARPV